MTTVQTFETGTDEGTTVDTARTAGDIRRLIPELGLREYWYPALPARFVRKKPVGMKMLGDQIVFFRGKDGEVKALSNVCPHRGGSLMHGDCHYPEHTRQVYFHYAYFANSWLGKLYEFVQYHVYHRWAMYTNFSAQDMRALVPQRYDCPENLSATDSGVVAWRRLLLQARGVSNRQSQPTTSDAPSPRRSA